MTKIIKQKWRANSTAADFVLPISKKESLKKIQKNIIISKNNIFKSISCKRMFIHHFFFFWFFMILLRKSKFCNMAQKYWASKTTSLLENTLFPLSFWFIISGWDNSIFPNSDKLHVKLGHNTLYNYIYPIPIYTIIPSI